MTFDSAHQRAIRTKEARAADTPLLAKARNYTAPRDARARGYYPYFRLGSGWTNNLPSIVAVIRAINNGAPASTAIPR